MYSKNNPLIGGCMETSTSLVVRKQLTKTQTLLLYFFIYSFIGWLSETLYSFCVLGHFTNRGFLFGPICPIYGFGAIIMLIFIQSYQDKPLKLFLLSAIIFSVFEYIVGSGLDAIFATKWWDYTNDFLNLNGRISILYTFFWGIAGLIFIHYVHPFVKKIVTKFLNKFPFWFQINLVTIFTLILVVDTVFSSIHYLI